MGDLKCFKITAIIDRYIREFVDQDTVKCIGTERIEASVLVVAKNQYLAMCVGNEYFERRKPADMKIVSFDEPVFVIQITR